MTAENSPIPTQAQNPDGLHRRYLITKVSGEAIDPRAEYFVLRVDEHGSDLDHVMACRRALLVYAHAIRPHLPQLASDLEKRYGPK